MHRTLEPSKSGKIGKNSVLTPPYGVGNIVRGRGRSSPSSWREAKGQGRGAGKMALLRLYSNVKIDAGGGAACSHSTGEQLSFRF